MWGLGYEHERNSRDIAIIALFEFRAMLQKQGIAIPPALLCDSLKQKFSIAIEPRTLKACYRDARQRVDKRNASISVAQAMDVGLTAFGKNNGNGS